MEDKAWDSQGKVRLGKRAEASFPTRTGELGTGRGSESRGQRGSGLDSQTHARAELGFRVPKSRGMGLAWLVLRKLLDTGGGGISCLRSSIGRRLSCSSKTAGDPDGWLPRHRRSAHCGSEAPASAESFLPMCLLRALLSLRRAHHSWSPGPFCPRAPRAPAQRTGAHCCPPKSRCGNYCCSRCRSWVCDCGRMRPSLGGGSAAS